MELEIGDLKIEQQSDQVENQARNMVGEKIPATITPFMFRNQEGCVLLAGLHEFEDGTALFAGMNLISGPEKYARAVQAGRVEVQKHANEQYSSRIKVFKSSNGDHPTLASLSWVELSKLAGVQNFQDELKKYGAEEFGTAEEILGVMNKTRNQLAMIYPQNDIRSLVIMWGVTRINALAVNFGTQGFQGQ